MDMPQQGRLSVSKPHAWASRFQFEYLPQGAALTTMGVAILDHGGSHIGQLPMQGVCKMSFGVLGGGGPSSSSVHSRWWWWRQWQHHDSDKRLSLAAWCARLKNFHLPKDKVRKEGSDCMFGWCSFLPCMQLRQHQTSKENLLCQCMYSKHCRCAYVCWTALQCQKSRVPWFWTDSEHPGLFSWRPCYHGEGTHHQHQLPSQHPESLCCVQSFTNEVTGTGHLVDRTCN